jgi:WG containing repeat
MKKILVFIFFTTALFAQSPLFPQKTDGGFDYIDVKGSVVFSLNNDYAAAQPFSENRAAVQDAKTKLFGYIDEKGKWAVKPQYTEAAMFKGGLAYTARPCDSKCLTDGEGLLSFEYTQFIDKNGKTIVEDNSQDPESYKRFWFDNYNDGELLRSVAAISVGDLKYMTNRKGERIGERSGGLGRPDLALNDNTILYVKNEGIYYTDKNAKPVLTLKNTGIYSFAYPFSEGYAALNDTANNWLMIDKKGKTILKFPNPETQAIGAMSEGLFTIKRSDFYNYMNINQKTILTGKYDIAQPFKNGLAHVQSETTGIGYIDKTGKMAITLAGFDATNYIFGDFEDKNYAFIYKTREDSKENALVGIILRDGSVFWSAP